MVRTAPALRLRPGAGVYIQMTPFGRDALKGYSSRD